MKRNGALLGVLVVLGFVKSILEQPNDFMLTLNKPFELFGMLLGSTITSAAVLFIPALLVGLIAKIFKKNLSSAFNSTAIVVFITWVIILSITFVYSMYIKPGLV